MDSIIKGDDENGNEKRKKRILKIDMEKKDEIVVVKLGPEAENEDEGERKKSLARMLPDEVFKVPKTSSRKPACFNCLFVFTIGFLIIMLIILLIGIRFIGKDLLISHPIKTEPVTLSIKDKEYLDLKMEEFRQVTREAARINRSVDYKLILTGDQLNYLLEQVEKSQAGRNKIYLRIFPNDERARIDFSLPYKANRFLNFNFEGIPTIEHYEFKMKIFSLQMGNIKKAMGIKDRLLRRINLELDKYPRLNGLPFRVKTMKIKSNMIHLLITVRPRP